MQRRYIPMILNNIVFYICKFDSRLQNKVFITNINANI